MPFWAIMSQLAMRQLPWANNNQRRNSSIGFHKDLRKLPGACGVGDAGSFGHRGEREVPGIFDLQYTISSNFSELIN